MLSAEAVRLLAIEALLPTASLPDGPFPTLAGARVFDSRAAAITDIDAGAPYTVAISLYTPESGSKTRAPGAAMDDRVSDCVLDVVAELVTAVEGENGETYVEPLADGDATTRLVLAALVSQINHRLMLAAEGQAWRSLVRDVLEIEQKTVSVPEFGLRLQRVVTRFHLSIVEDDFDLVAGGLPQPMRGVWQSLPDGSYAKDKLGELDAVLSGAPLTPLTIIHGLTVPEGAGFGPDFT
jgi:hypothetical protein